MKNEGNAAPKTCYRKWRLVKYLVVPYAVLHLCVTSRSFPRLRAGGSAADDDDTNSTSSSLLLRQEVSQQQQQQLLQQEVPAGNETAVRQEQQQEEFKDAARAHPDANRLDSFLSLVKGARNRTGTWNGNEWIPPQPWRMLSPAEMQEFYSQKDKSMLWIGDSTGRRTALMMFELLLLPSPSSLPNADAAAVPETAEQQQTKILDTVNRKKVIDEGRRNERFRHPCNTLLPMNIVAAAKRPDTLWPHICRPVPLQKSKHSLLRRTTTTQPSEPPGVSRPNTTKTDDDTSSFTNHNNTTATSSVAHKKSNKFAWDAYLQVFHLDFFGGNHAATATTTSPHVSSVPMEHFDLVILTVGIWDVIKEPAHVKNVSLERRVHGALAALDAIQQEPAMQHTQIVWRTSGFYDKSQEHRKGLVDTHMKTMRINQAAKKGIEDIAERHAQKGVISNITYFDWGGAVEARSFGKDRIAGDIAPHYGFMPRYVAIQMLTNHLMDLERFHSQYQQQPS